MSVTNQSVADVSNQSDAKDLKVLVAELGARVASLEEELAARQGEVSEDVLLAISAACAAFLGKRASIKHVRLSRGSAWASAGRAAVQHSHSDLRGTR